MKPTYIIYCPWNKPTSGGQIVLHKLAYNLAKSGEKVLILSEPMFPHENLQWVNTGKKKPDHIDYLVHVPYTYWDETVVIYPEIIKGNPLIADHVCRWILYDTDVKDREGTEESWDVDDEFFYFGKWVKTFLQEDRTGKILTAYDFKLEMVDMFPPYAPTKDTCILYRKRSEMADPLIVAGFDDITEHFTTIQDFINVVGRYRRFVTYDDSTYYSVLAALAGCESVILGTTMTPEKFRSLNPVLKYGVAYDNTSEELHWAEKTRPLITAHLEVLESLSLSQTENFCNFWENKLCK